MVVDNTDTDIVVVDNCNSNMEACFDSLLGDDENLYYFGNPLELVPSFLSGKKSIFQIFKKKFLHRILFYKFFNYWRTIKIKRFLFYLRIHVIFLDLPNSQIYLSSLAVQLPTATKF